MSPPSYDWLVADLAINLVGAVSVALAEADIPHANSDIMDRWGLDLLFAAPHKIQNSTAADDAIVALGGEWAPVTAIYPKTPRNLPIEEGTHALVFGSGTSGARKGMVISRRGLEATIDDFIQMFGISSADSVLVFMPLSILQQRMICYGALEHGANIHIVPWNAVFQAVRMFKPSIVIGPPAFYEAIRANRLAKLFGHCRLMISGMAKIKRLTLEHLEAEGLPIFEAYALAECGLISANSQKSRRMGSVGKPFPGTEVVIDEEGQVIVRKAHLVASGYFYVPGSEPRSWNEGDWWKTGDCGRLDSDGFLYIDGRLDEIIVTESGNKIHPAHLEARLEAIPYIRKAVIFHHPKRPLMVAICELDIEQPASAEHALRLEMDTINETLPEWCRIGEIKMSPEPFTVENGFLTPNLKFNRAAIQRHFLT